MTKKIIAIDLDGTLLRSDSTLSDYSIDTIKKVSQKGHTVVIATGRPYLMAKPFYQQLGLETPMICFNGALTHQPGTVWEGEHLATIDRRYLFDLLEQKDRFELDFIASEFREHFFITLDRKEQIQPSLFGVNELSDDLALTADRITTDPLALLVQTRHADKYQLAKEIKAYFNHQLEVDSWGGPLNILEFSAKGINKAYALKHLLNHIGAKQDQLIAFGDEHNDTEMLAFAQTGYAMRNANPILVPIADYHLPYSNDDDGVARKLSELFL